jgi:hypothetical protein
MQLVAYGAQDVYLTGNPQITYFKVVYRRHTNFSIEMDALPIDSAKPSGTFTVPILRNADLAHRMYFQFTTPALTTAFANGSQVAWVRRLGHAAIKTVKIQIGGTDIDKHWGVWLDIWYELTHTATQERGYNKMIGDVPELTTLSSSVDAYTLYVPLQFWFNRNPGLALPLIALQYHDVRLYVELEDLNKLIVWSGANAPLYNQVGSYDKPSILVDYIYLDSEERRRFAQVGHEYLIEQLQFGGVESIQGSFSSSIPDKKKINFNHPCKEIVWALKVGAFNGSGNKFGGTNSRGRFLCYTNDDSQWNNALDYAAANLAYGSFKGVTIGTSSGDTVTTSTGLPQITTPATLSVSSHESAFFSSTISTLANNTVNLTITVINNSGYTISPSTPILTYINNPLLIGSGSSSFNLLDSLAVSASNPNALVNLTVTFTDASGDDVLSTLGSNVVVTGHALTLRDVSVPLGDWTDNRYSQPVKMDVSVIQPSNYGLRLDGAGNPVSSGNIQLNGHDRFDVIDGNYFNYVQPYQHHTRTPCDGINVYSFGLHPEQHQPSGTANLSRIDTTILNVIFSDPYRSNKQVIQLNFVTDSEYYIYATNYNVLRIMSGMGGLAYSS